MRIKTLIIIISVALFAALTGCASVVWNYDISFECESVNNTLNNIKSGGAIAYADHKLYIPFGKDLYELCDGKKKQINTDALNVDNAPYGTVAHYFNYNDELYAIPVCDDIHTLMKYDSEKDEFIESDMQINLHYNGIYLSDNLCVWRGHNCNDMYVRYDNEEYIVDNKTDRFSVYDDVIYYTTSDGKLYSFDPKQDSPKSKFIKELENSYVHDIYVIKDSCYYLGIDATYRYSFSDDKTELITDCSVNNFNVSGDKLFLSIENDGIYCVEGNQLKRISDISANCIYSVDNEYLYSYNIDGNIFRIKIDSGETEPVIEIK